MKTYKAIEIRKYYKYTYSTFTQPVLSSDGTWGSDTFAVTGDTYYEGYEAYRAFDDNINDWCTFFKSLGGYLKFYNPYPLCLEEIQITNAAGDAWGTRAITSGVFYGSNDGINWTTLKEFTNSSTSGNAIWTISLDTSSYFKYFRLKGIETSYAQAGASDQIQVAELKAIGTVRDIIEGTSSDYDFYKDEFFTWREYGKRFGTFRSYNEETVVNN